MPPVADNDSLVKAALDTVPVQSLFQGHELQVRSIVPQSLEPRNPDWFSIALLLLLFWFTYTRVVYYKTVGQLFSAFFNINATNQIVRDENILVQRASVMMSLIFYCALALFVFLALEWYSVNIPWLGTGLFRFLFILLGTAMAYSLKTILLKLLGNVFDIERPAASYIFNFTLINNATGVVLLPLVMITAYLNTSWVAPFFYLSIAVLIISFIYRQIRAFRIWATMPGVPFFYFILYICTLEISPLLILFKMAKG
ncbi:MAG: DUF4271 domain-containing protein [Bacteroidia bacterium]